MQRAQGSVDWDERRDVFVSGVESKPISFVGAKCGGGDDPKQAKPKREC